MAPERFGTEQVFHAEWTFNERQDRLGRLPWLDGRWTESLDVGSAAADSIVQTRWLDGSWTESCQADRLLSLSDLHWATHATWLLRVQTEQLFADWILVFALA